MPKEVIEGSPAQEDEAWKSMCTRWLAGDAEHLKARKRLQELPELSKTPSIRIPAQGERVVLQGLQGRAEYNGTLGRITSQGPDAYGRFTVTLASSVRAPAVSPKKLKVHADRLLPYDDVPSIQQPPSTGNKSSIPPAGVPVELQGIQSRSEYNGSYGHISSEAPDALGRVTVTLASGDKSNGAKKLKVHTKHIHPCDSLPRTRTLPALSRPTG
mmetsp:Transcript_6424/g.11166  ORF Transcript_6424/g.11166 Transcript_6424/m.11166 type:complete len:214 (+) Transcript_6424:101-742(+)